MTKTLSAILIGLGLSFVVPYAKAQTVAMDEGKLDTFAHAVAKAEGFGVRGAIPTRYHNPGDLKTKSSYKWPGQIRIGKGGHVVFKNDAAGWAALRYQIRMALQGNSKVYNADMTIHQVAKKYAGNWRRWAKNVAHNLGVEPTMTLREYFTVEEVPAPSILIPGSFDSLREILKTNVTMPVLSDTEVAELDFAF